MQNWKWIVTAGLLAVVAATLFALLQPADHAAYVASIEKARRLKDTELSVAEDLPFRLGSSFAGLRYYAIDPNMSLRARASWLPQPQPTQLADNKGGTRPYVLLGTLHFSLAGQACSLQAFGSPQASGQNPVDIFIPFRDATNKTSSYPSGRFLDAQAARGADGRLPSFVTLDFNTAYNPYCAYDSAFTCPLPPQANALAVPIAAGEMRYH